MTKSVFKQSGDKKFLETNSELMPRFDTNGLITAIVTDYESGELLMVAHMNSEALEKTINSGQSHFWSRSRGELWHKGATSGTVQQVKEMRTDCDQDCVWLKVSVMGAGATCHTGMSGCFYRRIKQQDGKYILVRDAAEPLFDPKEIYSNKI